MQPTLPTTPRRRMPRPALAFAAVSIFGVVGVSDAISNRAEATTHLVETESDALVRNGDGTYRWGSLTLTGTDWTGAAGELQRTTRWPDDVIGVVGGRWDDQIDFGAAPGEGAEQVDIDFPSPASDVVLTVGMMGANEGGRGKDEAGIWRGYDAAGQLVADGVLDPDVSDLGPRVKARGYGEYPITLVSAVPMARVELIAVDWDPAGSPASTANNTDFGIVRVEWTDQAGGPSTTTPVATTTPAVTTAPPSTAPPSTEPPAPGTRRTVRGTDLLDDEGVRLVGRSLDGLPADVGHRRGGLGVDGGRYDFQIDYDAALDRSEMLIVEFAAPAAKIEIDLTMLEVSEWRDLPETGRWRARAATGAIVAEGVIDPAANGSTIRIDATDVIAVDLEATAYGNGVGTDRTDNNSDFAVDGVTWSASGEPTPTTAPPTTAPATTAPATTTPTTAAPTTTSPVTTTPSPPTDGSAERMTVAGTDLLGTDGLDLVFRTADGTVTTHGSKRGALGVAGGRYDFQLDVELDGERSESIELRFDPPATDIALTLDMLEVAEWRNLPETGRWTARDAAGSVVGTGVLDPAAAGSTSSTTEFELSTSSDVATVTIEATAYGNGAAVDRVDNNSDFGLAAVAWTRNAAAAEPPTTTSAPAPTTPPTPPPTTAPPTTAPATTPAPAPAGGATAMRSGAWSDPATWGGSVPVAGQAVVVPEGVAVSLGESTPSLGAIRVGGVLELADRTLRLTAESIMVTGEFRAGTAEAPITSDVVIELTGHHEHADHGARFLAVMAGGHLDLHAADRAKRSWTVLDGSVGAGATAIRVADPTGWEVGDRIVIAPSGLAAFEDEVVTITAIDGTAISFSPALSFDHHGAIETHDGRPLDMRAEVGLLTRNLVVTSAPDAEALRLGGHVMIMRDGQARVDGVELRDLGQSGRAGRYPFHWHLADDVAGQYVRNSSINRSFQRGVVIHETSNAVVQNVVAHDVFSHAFTFSETGPEWNNQLVNNLAVRVSHVPRDSGLFSFPRSNNPRSSSQAEERASGFWGRNPQNTLIGNRVAGVERGQGFFFDSRHMGHANKQAIKAERSPIVFRDNTAHAIEGISASLYNYGPVAVGHAVFVSTYVHDPTIELEGFTAYKAVTGAWIENGNTALVGSMVADSSAGVLTMHGSVRDSVIVGRSDNRVGGDARLLSDQRLGGGIHLTNQGKEKIVNLTDVTFVEVGRAAIVVRTTGLTDGSRVSGIRLIDTAPLFAYSSRSTGSIVDVDGSLCGTAGAAVIIESSACAIRS